MTYFAEEFTKASMVSEDSSFGFVLMNLWNEDDVLWVYFSLFAESCLEAIGVENSSTWSAQWNRC